MARLFRKHSVRTVKEFGTLGFVGAQKMETPVVNVFDYSRSGIKTHNAIQWDRISKFRESDTVTWVNVAGLHDTEFITKIGKSLRVHPMVIDKIANTADRASFEDYDTYVVISLKSLHFNEEELTVESEHMLFLLFDGMLLTFQENLRDPFGPLRERMMSETSRVRRMGADYLAFALIRAIVNEYGIAAEIIGEKIENLDNDIFSTSSPDLLEELSAYNGEISYLNRLVRPAKEAISSLCRSDTDLVDETKSQYIKNHLLENIWAVSDACENYRMMLHDQLSIYQTNVANRLNEMFRVLTVFSVIFVPLTFVAGIYGMNFEFIPELGYRYGYFIVWGVMISTAVGMLVYFKRKGWL